MVKLSYSPYKVIMILKGSIRHTKNKIVNGVEYF